MLAARLQGGYDDTALWAKAVERSSRVLLGLERGEPTGRKTLSKIETVLGWPVGWSHRILAGEVVGPPPETGGYVTDATDRRPSQASNEDIMRMIDRARDDLEELRRMVREQSLDEPERPA